MRKVNEEFKNLEPETLKELRLIRADLDSVKSAEELIKIISTISDLGEKTLAVYVPSGKIGLINSLQKEMVELYDSIFKILERSSFSEYNALQKFVESIKESYLNSVQLSKTKIAENFREKGCENRDNKNITKAMNFFDRALEINPNNANNWFERGNLFFDTGDFAQAIRDYEMVLKYDTMNPYALCNIGLCNNNLNMFKEAKNYFKEALNVSPKFKEALNGIGLAHLRLEEFAEAECYIKKALELYPDYMEAILNMGVLAHEYRYDFKESRKLAEKVLELDPENIIGKANLAETLLAFGENEYELSARYSAEVLKKGPPEFGYAMRLVKVCSLYFRKKMAEATEAAIDLVKYYVSVYDKIFSPWKFIGLRKTVNKNNRISEDVKSILNKLIDLAETPDAYAKNLLLKELPEQIKSIALEENVGIYYSCSDREITVKNTSIPNPIRKGYYNWSIFLSPSEALDEVEKVQYLLHKTFKNPIRTETNRNTGFMLNSSGWGEFQVKIKIYFKHKKEPLVKYHWLRLGYYPS